jgi:hypothetical protein
MSTLDGAPYNDAIFDAALENVAMPTARQLEYSVRTAVT